MEEKAEEPPEVWAWKKNGAEMPSTLFLGSRFHLGRTDTAGRYYGVGHDTSPGGTPGQSPHRGRRNYAAGRYCPHYHAGNTAVPSSATSSSALSCSASDWERINNHGMESDRRNRAHRNRFAIILGVFSGRGNK